MTSKRSVPGVEKAPSIRCPNCRPWRSSQACAGVAASGAGPQGMVSKASRIVVISFPFHGERELYHPAAMPWFECGKRELYNPASGRSSEHGKREPRLLSLSRSPCSVFDPCTEPYSSRSPCSVTMPTTEPDSSRSPHRMPVRRGVPPRDGVLELSFDVGQQGAGAEPEEVGPKPAIAELVLEHRQPVEALLGGANAAGRLEADKVAGARRGTPESAGPSRARPGGWR